KLARRTRELDLLQSLGRHASEAHTPAELFASVLAAIHHGVELDLAFVGHADREPFFAAFLARPFAESYLEAVRQRVTRFLGGRFSESAGEFSRVRLEGYDAVRGPRE